MAFFCRAFGALLALLIAPSHAASIEAYGRLPSLEDVSLSPDGTRIAFVRMVGDERIIAAVSLADNKPLGILKVGESKVRQVVWADDRHLLVAATETKEPETAAGRQYEHWQVLVYDVESRVSDAIPDISGISSIDSIVIVAPPAVRRIDGKSVVFLTAVVRQRDFSIVREIIRYDIEAKRQRIWYQAAQSNSGWILDRRGHIAAEEFFDGSRNHWAVKIAQDGEMRKVAEGIAPIDVPRLLAFGPDGDTVLMEQLEAGTVTWRPLSLADGSLGPPLAAGKALTEPMEDRFTGRLIGGEAIRDDSRYVFLDPAVQHRWDSILHAFEGARVRFASASEDYTKFVVRVESNTTGLRYQLIDFTTHKATPLGDVYEGVTGILEVRRIDYPAQDGLSIPAYLTLPHISQAKGLPLVVLPHGGPQVRDTADFDWWSQALADQGYAVLRPNFRGSALNQNFISAGHGQFGRKMQTDLSDGVRYLVGQGIVDPARVCIVGGSYGGYAALAGVSLERGVYRCAVAVAGISDPKSFLRWIDEKHGAKDYPELRYLNRFMGGSGIDDPVLTQISPLRNVDAVQVPVLLIHGRDDTVVPYDQSEAMFKALKNAGKPVSLISLDGEDHWLSRGSTRLQMLQETVAFLLKNNPVAVPAAGDTHGAAQLP